MKTSSGQEANEFCSTWMRDVVYDDEPEWAREQAIMQVPHPWHFFMSTTRKPSALGMTKRPSASSTPLPTTSAPPATVAEDARKQRRVSRVGSGGAPICVVSWPGARGGKAGLPGKYPSRRRGTRAAGNPGE